MTYTIIQFSKIENLCNKVLNIILWSLNLFLFSIGIYHLLNNYEDINKTNGIQDCGSIFLMIGLTVLNAFVILIAFFKFLTLSVFTFTSSLYLFSYQVYNFSILDHNCTLYYKENHSNIWTFYLICIGVLGINIFLYILKYINFLKSNKTGNRIDIERAPLVNNDVESILAPQENLYDDIDNYN
jgi:hypothetical protein